MHPACCSLFRSQRRRAQLVVAVSHGLQHGHHDHGELGKPSPLAARVDHVRPFQGLLAHDDRADVGAGLGACRLVRVSQRQERLLEAGIDGGDKGRDIAPPCLFRMDQRPVRFGLQQFVT